MRTNVPKDILIQDNKIDFDTIPFYIKNHSYQYIGGGTGRRVYDLNNNYVAKVARNRKGIAQNKVEYNIFTQRKEPLLACLIGISDDSMIVIMEKANQIKNIQIVYEYYQVKNSSELYRLEEFKRLSNQYDLVLRDFGRASSWGIIDNRPKIVDYGFTRQVRRKYYRFF